MSIEPTGLFFWARSGGGHRTAKEGIKQQKIKEYAAQGRRLDTSFDVDITGPKVLGFLGDWAVNAWDSAQRRGDLSYLERHAWWGWLAEFFMYPIVYFRTKWMLQSLSVEPEFVVSTQAFCINAIVSAMRTVNHEKGWNMRMDVHLTDMPSKKASHFFPSIRKLSNDDELCKMVTLHAPKPIIKPTESEEEFWQRHIGKVKVITDDTYPIRQAFLDTEALKNVLFQPTYEVPIRLNRPEEGPLNTTIKQEDKVAMLMLGSVPTTEAVHEWLKLFARESKEAADKQRTHHFFLYCGQPGSELWHSVKAELSKLELPANCNIVPFTDQDDTVIAPLMARCDMSITRSGGLTSMELIQLAYADIPKRPDKKVLIHSEGLFFPKPEPKPAKEFVKSIITEVATHMAKKRLLSSPEWQNVRTKMQAYLITLGYNKQQSIEITEKVLEYYAYNDQNAPLKPLEETFKELQAEAAKFSQENPTSRALITAQMQKMMQKQAYKDLDLSSLRKLAIQRVLIKEGIVLWEGGNAKYLTKAINAEITNPHYAKESMRAFFS